MVIFKISPIFTEISKCNVNSMMIINNALEFNDELYYIKQQYCRFKLSGKIKFLHNKWFPTGLLLRVLNKLEQNKIKYKIKKTFTYPKIDKDIKDFIINIDKRKYQIDAVQSALENKRGYIQIATAGGKTEIARLIVQILEEKTLYLVHLKELLHQTRKSFAKRIGVDIEDIGIVGDGKFEIKDITISTIQTLSRNLFFKDTPPPEFSEYLINKTKFDKLKTSKFESYIRKIKKRNIIQNWLDDIKVLFVDECHHISSDSFYKLVMRIPAIYRFGMSATPITDCKIKNIRLIAATGNRIYKKSTKALKKEGYISDADITMIPIFKVINPEYNTKVNLQKVYPDFDSKDAVNKMLMRKYFKKKRKVYQKVYTRGIVLNKYRNKKILEVVEKNKDKQILILVERTKHIKILDNMIKDLYSKNEFIKITGSTSGNKREKIREDFNDKKIKCILSTIFKEGFDLPDIECLIIAGGLQSNIITRQRLGRGLRISKTNSNKKLIVYDFYDYTHNFLERHSQERKRIYEKDNFRVRIIK